MVRRFFDHDGLTLSYLDAGDGEPLIALHSHWMEGATFIPLAEALAPAWRVIALDQRGHGHSAHARSYRRDDYLGDLAALFDHLRLERAVLLGNSLGGVNAYQFAARHPKRVRALIIEEIGVEVSADSRFTLDWAGTFPTREALAERVGPRFLPYLEQSFRETPDGWRLAFEPRDMVASQEETNGEYWDDWLASSCPALLVRASDSRFTTAAHVEQMAVRRPNTRYVALEGGHVLHADNAPEFAAVVRAFLAELRAGEANDARERRTSTKVLPSSHGRLQKIERMSEAESTDDAAKAR